MRKVCFILLDYSAIAAILNCKILIQLPELVVTNRLLWIYILVSNNNNIRHFLGASSLVFPGL